MTFENLVMMLLGWRVVSTGWNRWEENWRKLMIAGEKDNRVTWFGYPVVKFRNRENFDNFQFV